MTTYSQLITHTIDMPQRLGDDARPFTMPHLAGAVAAIAAWASIGRVGAIGPNNWAEANLQSITAVVIGGISLFGGRGSILGPLFGALIVGTVESGLRLAGLDVQWQIFAIGWLIIIAVAIDQWIRKVSV